MRVYFKLYHEREQEQSQYVMCVAEFPYLIQYVVYDGHLLQYILITVLVVLLVPDLAELSFVLFEVRKQRIGVLVVAYGVFSPTEQLSYVCLCVV